MILSLSDHEPMSRAEKVRALWPEGVEVMRAIAAQPRDPEAAAFARAALDALGLDAEATPRGDRHPITDGVG